MSADGRRVAGHRIEVELLDRDWTQADLAEKARIGEDTVSDLINARTVRPRPRTLRSIENVFGWDHGTIRDMFEGVAPPPRQLHMTAQSQVLEASVRSATLHERRARARAAMPDLPDDDFEVVFALAERLRTSLPDPERGQHRAGHGQ